MGSNKIQKVKVISVEEILKHDKKKYDKDLLKEKALIELEHYVKEIGLKNACSLSGYAKIIRSSYISNVSENLSRYIVSRTNFQLKRDITKLIILDYGVGSYTSFTMSKFWERKKRGLFYYYYYSDHNYVNVFSIPHKNLPLYVNRIFSKEDREIYLNRMRGVSDGC